MRENNKEQLLAAATSMLSGDVSLECVMGSMVAWQVLGTLDHAISTEHMTRHTALCSGSEVAVCVIECSQQVEY